MPDKPENPFKFWEELKRRKVFRVIVTYSGAAYIIIELVSNVAEPLHLPDWIPTFLVLLLIIGFPIIAILSWIFDITPEGLKKTAPIKGVNEKETEEKPVKRKLNISDLIIAVLFVVVIILAYPRIFKSKASLRTMTMPVTIVNEYGENETHTVFKEEYVTNKLKIFPFKNVINDSTDNWVGSGIREALYEDFLQFDYMVIDIRDVEFAYSWLSDINYYNINRFNYIREQIKKADENNCSHFLTGSYQLKDGYYEISSQLYQTKSGAIKKENLFRGRDLFELIDSISLQTRIDLGVSHKVLNSYPDLPVKDHMTSNLNAFHKYIEGLHDWNLRKIREATEMDSTFILPLIHLTSHNLFFQGSNITALKDINHAMRHKERLSEYRSIKTRVLYYQILGETDKADALMVMNYRLHPNNSTILEMLWDFYNNSGNYFRAVEVAEQLNQLVPGYPRYELNLIRSYQFNGQFNKGIEINKKLLQEDPENISGLLSLGKLFLLKNEYDAAGEIFDNLILLYPEKEWIWSLMQDHIAFALSNKVDQDFLKQVEGNYIFDSRRMIETNFVLNNQFLVIHPTNQGGLFSFPVSDTEFVSALHNMAMTDTYYMDSDKKIIKRIHKESFREDLRSLPGTIIWKLDSLILKAEKLLQTNQVKETHLAFQKAYSENPEHYYLANYINHLDFIQSEEYEETKPVFDTYTGEYDNMKIFKENDQFFIETSNGNIFKLLLLSRDQFMNSYRYQYIIQIVKEDNHISGLKIIFNNGDEIYIEKTSEQ